MSLKRELDIIKTAVEDYGLDARRMPQAKFGGATSADLIVEGFLCEEKTRYKGFALLSKWWSKVSQESSRIAREPALFLTLPDCSFVMISEDSFFRLLKRAKMGDRL